MEDIGPRNIVTILQFVELGGVYWIFSCMFASISGVVIFDIILHCGLHCNDLMNI